MAEQQHIERKFRELHDYIRHIFQALVGWFTFFATVNYATMGWLAKSSGSNSTSTTLIWVVSVLFITQNALGVAVCFAVRRYLFDRNAEVIELERLTTPIDSVLSVRSSVPLTLYCQTIRLMVGALAVILLAWCVIPVVSM
jgi:hypothetical protein